jgi:hypothetical protein
VSLATAAAASFREPAAAPAAYITVDATRPGLHLQVNFPPAANAGPQRQSYWLTGAEPLVLDIQAAAGLGGPSAPLDVFGTLLIDARQVAVAIDGGSPALSFRRVLRPGQVDRFVARLRGARIPPGAHTASLLFWRAGGRPFPSVGFSVFKDSTKFAARDPTPGIATSSSSRRGASGLTGGSPPALLMGTRLASEGGGLALGLFIEGYDGLSSHDPLGVSFAAFLDGQQVPLGGLGVHPFVQLAGDQRAQASFFIRAVPPGSGQVVTVFALPGDGMDREVGGRPTAAMLNPELLGSVRMMR